METDEIKAFLGVVGLMALLGVIGYGWIANLMKLWEMLDGPVTGIMIGRAVGVFMAPIGVILGFM